MKKTFFSCLLAVLLLFLMVGIASAASNDFGLGLYDSHGLCLSGKYDLSRELTIQGLASGDYFGLRGIYDLAQKSDFNIFGYGQVGFLSKGDLAVDAGVGFEYFVFKALDIKELARLGFSLDFGLKILPSTDFGFGGGFHYYF